MTERELPEHVRDNRAYWDGRADQWVAAGEAGWRASEPGWGIWELPESSLRLLPADMTGMTAIELGCGTGYVSAWMARRGARVVGIDNSQRQLATARRLATEHAIELTLLHGNAETVPYPDASFDFAISEYGAAIWCDPMSWIPEAHRLLRAGGQLVFLGNAPIATLCMPPSGAAYEAQLHRSDFDLHRVDWTQCEVDPGGVEFNLPISKWLQLFRETGFEVLDYLELQAPPGSNDRHYSPGWWAERWPSEHVWKLRKR
jgi:SAM-dependent methyltransferase